MPRDVDKVDEVDRSMRYGEYLAVYCPQIVPQPSRERVDSPYRAKDVTSIVSETSPFLWRIQF